MTRRTSFAAQLIIAAIAALASSACGGKEYVRGANDPSIDQPAMSTGLDKDDIERTLQTLLNQMRAAPIMDDWRVKAGQSNKQTVAIAPFQNETDEHIDSQLDAMVRDRDVFVNAQITRRGSISPGGHDSPGRGAQHLVFDPRHIPQYGKQLGVQFYITGKVGASSTSAPRTRAACSTSSSCRSSTPRRARSGGSRRRTSRSRAGGTEGAASRATSYFSRGLVSVAGGDVLELHAEARRRRRGTRLQQPRFLDGDERPGADGPPPRCRVEARTRRPRTRGRPAEHMAVQFKGSRRPEAPTRRCRTWPASRARG